MACDSQKDMLQSKMAAIEEQAYALAGHPFSLTSPEDISQVGLCLSRLIMQRTGRFLNVKSILGHIGRVFEVIVSTVHSTEFHIFQVPLEQ